MLRVEEAVRDAEAAEAGRLRGACNGQAVIDVAQSVVDHEAHVGSPAGNCVGGAASRRHCGRAVLDDNDYPAIINPEERQMGRLAGKVAIVTGGARGMGEATSRLFAAEAAKVVIADVLDREGEALAGAIGSAALFRHHDVTDEASWEAVTADALRQFGGVDVLVNNAGVLLFKAITDTTKAEFERVIGVNLVGTSLGIKIARRK